MMNNDTGFFAVVKREFSFLKREKRFTLGMTLMPVVSFLFLVALFGDSTIHNLPIAVVDADHSVLSRKYGRMIDATAGLQVDYEPQSVEQAEQLMLEGKIDAVLYIPVDFEKDIYKGNVTEPKLYISGMRLLNSSLIYRDVLMTTQTLSTGIELELMTKNGKSESQAMQLALPSYYEKHVLFNPYTSYGYYLTSPFNTLMIVLFALLSSLFSVGLEMKNGTTEQWVATAGGSVYKAVFAKLLPYTFFYVFWALLTNIYIFAVEGTPLNGSFAVLMLATVAVIIGYQLFGLLLFALTAKLTLAMSLGAALSTMSFTMSGLTFPLMAMNNVIFLFAHLFPFTHYLYAYIDQMRGNTALHSLPYIITIMIYPIITTLLIPRLINICKNNKE